MNLSENFRKNNQVYNAMNEGRSWKWMNKHSLNFVFLKQNFKYQTYLGLLSSKVKHGQLSLVLNSFVGDDDGPNMLYNATKSKMNLLSLINLLI